MAGEIYGDIIYFELNNWFAGRDYPNAEPFITWMRENKFSDREWIKENKLVVVKSYVDMSFNFCVSATRELVQKNCPKLLTYDSEKYTIIRHSRGEDEVIEYNKIYANFLRDFDGARFGYFLEYTEDNIGLHINEGEDYDLWNHDEDEEEE